MKTYVVKFRPKSSFGTALKGDTIFGHLCWQAANDNNLFGAPLVDLLADYHVEPFLVASSAVISLDDGSFTLKKPSLPHFLFKKRLDVSGNPLDKNDLLKERKKEKARKWFFVSKAKPMKSFVETHYIDDSDLWKNVVENLPDAEKRIARLSHSASACIRRNRFRNTIDRLTGSTGEGRFAPFSCSEILYWPDVKLAVFVGILEHIGPQNLREAFERIGAFGFGRDASVGLGKFDVETVEEIDMKELGAVEPANACYTLSPCLPGENIEKSYFHPFIRYGRHGDRFAVSSNPFKNPVLMADESAVLMPKSSAVFTKPWIGKAVTDISITEPKAVCQGYSLYLPVTLEVNQNAFEL